MSIEADNLESRSVRLARYLREFVALRSGTVRDVAQYESVLWFSEMPHEADCRSGAWTDDYDPEEPWLEVHKQQFTSPPDPPEVTSQWVDAPALRKATPEVPPLRASIFVEDVEAIVSEGEERPLVERRLADHPEVVAAYEAFRPRWEAWSVEHRRRERVQRIYAELFRLHNQLQKRGEIVEVVLGLGLIDWRAKIGERSIPIRRHAVIARVELHFDPTSGVIRVGAPGAGARLRIEDDMLEAELRPDRSHYAAVEAQLEAVGDAIWDKALIHTALRTWSGALGASSTWFDGLEAKQSTGTDPTLSFAPALILRPRLQTGMLRIYDELITQLRSGSHGIPAGWGRLTDDEWGTREGTTSSSEVSDRERPNHTPTEIYFPLPANREQRRIVQALAREQGVLVQGPPGTGKSHTIANLMCHLLATGKRVLVTAETSRALQILKDKLPEEIRPLCVSLLGQGGDEFAELNAAVQGITNRHSSYTPGAYDDRIAEIEREFDARRRKLAETDAEIRTLRADETQPQSLLDGWYQGTPSKIAARVAEERARLGWLPLRVDESGHSPISNTEVSRWLDIRRRYTDEEITSSALRIPDSATLPVPMRFASFVANEAAARASSERVEAERAHRAFATIRALSMAARGELREDLKSIEEHRLALLRQQAEWLPAALRDLTVGRDERWQALLALSKEKLEHAEMLLSRVANRSVTWPEGLDARKLRSDACIALEHLKAGGKWKRLGVATPKILKGRTYLKKGVLVDGRPADDVELLSVVCDHLDLEFTLSDLLNAWKDVGVTGVPVDRRLRMASLREHSGILAQALDYAAACDLSARVMSRESPPIAVPNWLDGETQRWLAVIEAADLDERLAEAARQVQATGHALTDLRQLHDIHPVVNELYAAITARDVTAYSACYERLLSIERVRKDQEERSRVETKIAQSAPGLVARVEATLNDSIWDARFASWEEAWRWAIAHAWLEKRTDYDYQRKLWDRRRDLETEICRLIAETASLRAWAHFFDHLSPRKANALRSWREAVRAMGKGTGKSVKMARLRQDARRYMDECRDAIPVWIMPRYLVAEMIHPVPGRYDLVIVDEASQLGIESLFLFYIANQLIVVGDDQQISPAGVGIADAAVASLQQHFLSGVPHQHALSPQSSLYGNAKIRFNQNIVLREHFRCMPEIIQFSNDLCYAPNGTPLDPLRAYPVNRLEPLVLRRISDGYRTGSAQHAQNPPEAEAIVAQICACIEDPRYAGATMGVISLQGEAQAKLIENMLLAVLDPAVIEERRLICGDAYAFQGDERNVIFLSMVAAPGEVRIGALANEAARQRFNVAVSRAQDQLWLFHSVELDLLSTTCMRRRLLSYMQDPRRQTTAESEQRFESKFEFHVYQRITNRGFHVRTQVCVGDPTNHRYRIDLVVEGMQGRLAVECDGDEWHGPDRYEQDMARQRDLERAGWRFARVRGGDFYRDPDKAMEPVWAELDRLGIRPGGIDAAAAQPPTPHPANVPGRPAVAPPEPPPTTPASTTAAEASSEFAKPRERRAPTMIPLPFESEALPHPEEREHRPEDVSYAEENRTLRATPHTSTNARRAAVYPAFEGRAGPDPRVSTPAQVAEGLVRIIDREGPMLAKRAYDLYLRGSGVRRIGGELRRSMNRALQHALRQGCVVSEDELGRGGLVYSIVRCQGTPPVIVRERGPRDLEEIPPSELQVVARRLARDEGFELGSDAHLRAVLEFFELQRLTVQIGTRMLDILARRYPYVDDLLDNDEQQK